MVWMWKKGNQSYAGCSHRIYSIRSSLKTEKCHLADFCCVWTGNKPLVKEENVGGSKRRHNPHQPAHVARPRTQLPQVQPGKTSTDEDEAVIRAAAWRECIYPHSHTLKRLGCLPRSVGSGNEEVDDHPVTHVETLLHRPEESVFV